MLKKGTGVFVERKTVELKNMRYCIIQDGRVVFASISIAESISFIIGRGDGVLCSIVRPTE